MEKLLLGLMIVLFSTGLYAATIVVGGGGGAATFTELTDSPASYTGQSGKSVTIKGTEDGVEFTTVTVGETNTASNQGVGGVGPFSTKTGVDLEFKNINIGSSKVSVTNDVGNKEIDIDIVEGNIDHDALLNFNVLEHFLEGSIDHANILNIGTNAHSVIDTHLGSTSNPHSVTKTQVSLGNVEDLKVNLVATTAPGTGNDNTQGYAVGSRWFDVTNDKEYAALDVSTGAAVWVETTSQGTTTFLGLTDTPSSFTGNTLKLARVNAGETALEFATVSVNGDFSNGGEAAGAARNLGNTDLFPLSFITNNVIRMTIASTGNININNDGTVTPLTITTDADATNVGANFNYIHTRPSFAGAAGEIIANMTYQAEDDAGSLLTYAGIVTEIASPAAGAEEGRIRFKIVRNGTYSTAMVIDQDFNVYLGPAPVNVSGTAKVLAIESGTAPLTPSAIAVQLYSSQSGSDHELRVMDGAGNITLLSPHPDADMNAHADPSLPYPWGYEAENAYLGKRIFVDIAGAIKEIEALTGKQFMWVTDIAKRDWDTDQEAHYQDINTIRQPLLGEKIVAEAKGEVYTKGIPDVYVKGAPPQWMRDRGVTSTLP